MVADMISNICGYFNAKIGDLSEWIAIKYLHIPSTFELNSTLDEKFILFVKQVGVRALISYNIKVLLYNTVLSGTIVCFVASFFYSRALISFAVCFGSTLFIDKAIQKTALGIFGSIYYAEDAPFRSHILPRHLEESYYSINTYFLTCRAYFLTCFNRIHNRIKRIFSQIHGGRYND